MAENGREVVVRHAAELGSVQTRRNFLRALGLGGTIVLLPSVFAACNNDPASPDAVAKYGLGRGGGSNNTTVTLNLSNDIGILNYAYALEQLEAAFYSQVVAASNFTTLFPSAADQEAFADIRNDEVAHRQFYTVALGSAAIPALSVDFGTNLSSRSGVLNLGRTFEDLGVAAYNGAGQYLRNANNLLVAGKIVSVEARHASALRDIDDATGKNFADLSTLTANKADATNALDGALVPSDVLPKAAPFIKTTVTIGTQPS